MTLRPIFALLVALAMLLAPFIGQGSGAIAAAPADHHGQLAKPGHCDERPAQDQGDEGADKPCCAAMCQAIAVEPAQEIEPFELSRIAARLSRARTAHSYLAELPTPPPRLA